jgi:hypothetical protein
LNEVISFESVSIVYLDGDVDIYVGCAGDSSIEFEETTLICYSGEFTNHPNTREKQHRGESGNSKIDHRFIRFKPGSSGTVSESS